jgi:type IV secretory pathway VirB10-like protein
MEGIIHDKAPKPSGLLPKNLQAFVLVGIALMMVLVMAVTGRNHPTAAVPQAQPITADSVPVNADKVTDFQKGIERTQRASAPQAEAALLEQQRRLAAQQSSPEQPPAASYAIPLASPTGNGTYPSGVYPAVAAQPGGGSTAPDPIVDEQRKRQYVSLFANNLALSYRKGSPPPETGPILTPPADPSTSGIGGPAIAPQGQVSAPSAAPLAPEEQLWRQMQLEASAPPGRPAEATYSNRASPIPARDPGKTGETPEPGAFNSSAGKTYVLFEGAVLEAVLLNRLDGSFSGPLTCLLSTNVYSHDRQHLLIPAGSKLLGEARKVDTFGQLRLAVFFHRLIMPDGYSVGLDQFKGLDQEGATALQDKVNHHYAKIFGASLALGILGGVAQLGTGSVLTSSGIERIQQGSGAGLANAGEQVLDRFLNILPTVTIREGTRVKVYLSDDLLLPEYPAHTLPPNL